MTWSYSGDPKSSIKDEYRFLIMDTDQKDPVLQDEEINYILGKYSDTDLILYHLFDAASNVYAKTVAKNRLGPQSEDTTDRLRFFQNKATYYRTRTVYMGVSFPGVNIDSNTGKPEKYFGKDMMRYVRRP